MLPEQVGFTIYVTAVNERNGSAAASGSPGCWTCARLRGLSFTLLGPILNGLLLFVGRRPCGSVRLPAARGALGQRGALARLFGRDAGLLSLLAALAAGRLQAFSGGKAGTLLRLRGAGRERGRVTRGLKAGRARSEANLVTPLKLQAAGRTAK